MQILEHGQKQEQTLLFFPCTAEPVWAFTDTIALLSQKWHTRNCSSYIRKNSAGTQRSF